jgi:hypothetical protein
MIYGRQPQATRFVETPSWTGLWSSLRGDRWRRGLSGATGRIEAPAAVRLNVLVVGPVASGGVNPQRRSVCCIPERNLRRVLALGEVRCGRTLSDLSKSFGQVSVAVDVTVAALDGER